jgi:hypothetical protein
MATSGRYQRQLHEQSPTTSRFLCPVWFEIGWQLDGDLPQLLMLARCQRRVVLSFSIVFHWFGSTACFGFDGRKHLNPDDLDIQRLAAIDHDEEVLRRK